MSSSPETPTADAATKFTLSDRTAAETDSIDTTAAAAPTEGTEPRRWTLDIRPGERELQLADGFLLEWKADLPANQPGGVQAQIAQAEGQACLDILTPYHTQWTRLVAALNRHEEAPLAAIQLIVRLEAVNAAQPAVLEPMLALRPNANHSRREGKVPTRSRLTLEPGIWYAITGLFHIAPTPGRGAYDFMMNLPEGYRLRIARLDIDWLHSALHARTPLAEGEIEKILPFDAAPLAPGKDFPATPLTSGAVPSLRALSDLLAAAPATPSALAGHLLLQAGSAEGIALAEAMLRWTGQDIRIPRARPGAEPAPLLVTGLLRQHLRQNSETVLPRADHLAIQTLAELAERSEGLQFGPARPLTVQLETAPTAEDEAYWQAQQAAGLVDAVLPPGAPAEAVAGGQILTLASAGVRLAPLALAFLRSALATRAGAEIMAEALPQSTSSWKRLIVGYPTGELPLLVAGRLSALDAGGVPVQLRLSQVETAAPAASPRPALQPDQAFAFVVLQDYADDPAALVNIDNCLVFADFTALRAALADAGPRVMAKPVIPLSRHLSAAPDHLTTATADHWAQGGRYVLTAACSDYDRDSGQIRLSTPAANSLQRLALRAAILSLPLGEALRPEVEADLFLPSVGFALYLHRRALTDEGLGQLGRAFQPERLSAADHERLALAGTLDMTVLGGIRLSTNWPVEPIISAQVLRHQKTLGLLRSFVQSPRTASAEAALELITPASADLLHHTQEIGAFLLALSANPKVALALQPDRFATFLELARHAPEADRVAQNLSSYADQICIADIGLIIPLFELLAACLPPQALTASLSFAAARFKDASDRYVIRLAECMRRYGDTTGLALLLANLQLQAPAKLRNPGLLRSFQAVLSAEILPVLSAQVGPDVIRDIEAIVETTDRFQKAVQAGDRDRALRLAADSDAMRSVDFMRWMDGLRGLSNELRAMALPVARLAVPGINSLPRQRLASVIFSDTAAIADLQEAGLLKGVNSLNAVALHILGQNEMLNAMVAAPFAETPHRPLSIRGASTAEVFANAQAALAGLPDRTDGPLVTAIMSAFNPDIELMAAALGSITAQTHRNVEIIVIDDASTPDSAAAIRDLVARVPQARLIRLDVNYGPYIGRNLALREAKGDYIAIHDSDDWSHPERFAAQIAAFEATPEARLVTTQHIRIDRAGHVQLEGQFTILGDGPMTSLFRRDVFDEIGAFAQVRSRGDVEMRERLRSYFGHQAIVALPLPMVLCLAESTTLSQVTLANKAEYLQLFRTHISKRRPLANLRRGRIRLDDRHQLLVPQPLRSAMEALSE